VRTTFTSGESQSRRAAKLPYSPYYLTAERRRSGRPESALARAVGPCTLPLPVGAMDPAAIRTGVRP